MGQRKKVRVAPITKVQSISLHKPSKSRLAIPGNELVQPVEDIAFVNREVLLEQTKPCFPYFPGQTRDPGDQEFPADPELLGKGFPVTALNGNGLVLTAYFHGKGRGNSGVYIYPG